MYRCVFKVDRNGLIDKEKERKIYKEKNTDSVGGGGVRGGVISFLSESPKIR